MTNSSSIPVSPAVTSQEVGLILSDFQLLREQLNTNRISRPFLNQQIETAIELFGRLGSEQKRGKYERYEALATVSRLISSSLDLQTVLDQTMDALIQLTGAERGFLMLGNDDGELSVKAARNLDQKTLESESFQYSRSIANEVLNTGQPLLTTNAQEDSRFANRVSILSQALRSIMAVPLRARGLTIGVAYVDSRQITGMFDEQNLSLMEALAAQAAVAIENARLFSQTDQELSRRIEELQQLRRIDLLFNQTWDADQAIRYTVEWACRLTSANSGDLAMIDTSQDAAEIYADYHFGRVSHRYNLAERYPQLYEVVNTGKSSAFIEADEEDTQAVLILPLGREGSTIGIVILRREGSENFSDYQQDLVERMVKRAAITIENLMLNDQIRHYADELEHRVIERTNELRQAKDRAEAILNNTSDAIILTEADGHIQGTNPAFNELFGYDGQAVLPSLAELVRPSYQEALAEAIEEVVHNKVTRHIEVSARHKDGSTFFAEIALSTISEPGNKLPGLICSVRNISDRKQAEKQRIELVTERERVKILADFIRDASHDLRTPLSTVNTSLYLLQRVNSQEDQSHHLKLIEQQVSHLGKLIEGLLTMTRLDSEAVFNFRPVDINRLMRDLEIRTRLMAKGKGLIVNLKLALSIPSVRADERELYQALENVVENAVQFTPDCGSISLQTRIEDDAIAVEISDTGVGIGENDLAHIFERFYRADKARAISTGGLGLGLPIARKIIEAHGGSIEVKSLVDRGTTMIIRVPKDH